MGQETNHCGTDKSEPPLESGVQGQAAHALSSDRYSMSERQRGYTLLEILVALAVVGILAAIAVPVYGKYFARTRVSVAVIDIATMSATITQYIQNYQTPPDDLSQIGMQGKLDPWGNPYEYMNLTGVKGKGSSRKDKKLNPLNSDFDLYSKGKDGDSKLPLSPKVSQDDVLRARDGRFIGLASDFDP